MPYPPIAAPATVTGISALAVIRVSGHDCLSRCTCLFKSKHHLNQAEARQALYGHWQDTKQQILDEVIVTIFPASKSFTGEESFEISCHGSPYIVREILGSLLEVGVQIAEPGEFSKRAFLNGRLDLTEAEAVRDLIHAQSRLSHKQALGRLSGGLSSKIEELRQSILDLLAALEVAIDHADENLELDNYHVLESQHTAILKNMEHLLKGARAGRLSSEGLKIALTGKPNTGKSSLLNVLCGEDRAIVSDTAGTTRDVIEQGIQIEGLLLRLFDTAGIRSVDDPIEQEGVRRSLNILQEADLILWIRDGSRTLDNLDHDIHTVIADRPCILVNNKKDLGLQLSEGISLSVKTGEGLDLLFKAVKEFALQDADPEHDILLSNLRQEDLLKKAQEELQQSLMCLQRGDSEEFPAAHVRHARRWVEEITGRSSDDAILDRIFSRFCIGK